MKDTYYFPHDYEPTSDPKIQAMIGQFGAIGYGLFWRIVEMMHSDIEHKLRKKEFIFLALAKQMSTPVEQVKDFVEQCTNVFELFFDDDDFFWSERVLKNINYRDSIRERNSKAGKKSAETRNNSTVVERLLTCVEQNPTNKRKGKERKEKEIEERESGEPTAPTFSFKKSLLDKGANEKLVDDWMKVRKEAKATNTETALNGFLSQVEKSGRDIDEILQVCVEKSWKGFNASWKVEWESSKAKASYPTAEQFKTVTDPALLKRRFRIKDVVYGGERVVAGFAIKHTVTPYEIIREVTDAD